MSDHELIEQLTAAVLELRGEVASLLVLLAARDTPIPMEEAVTGFRYTVDEAGKVTVV